MPDERGDIRDRKDSRERIMHLESIDSGVKPGPSDVRRSYRPRRFMCPVGLKRPPITVYL